MQVRPLLPLAALAGCSGVSPPQRNTAAIDIGVVADTAQGRVDRYAAMRPAPPHTIVVRYRCAGGSMMTVRFDRRADTAQLRIGAERPAMLVERRAVSGIWYRGEGYDLRGKGRDATVERPDERRIACRALA